MTETVRQVLVSLQPSLHTLDDFEHMAIREAEALGVDKRTCAEWHDAVECGFGDEVHQEIIDKLHDLGYEVDTENDSFIVSRP